MKWLVDRLMVLVVIGLAGWYYMPKATPGPVRWSVDTVYEKIPGDTMRIGCVLDTARWVGVSDPQWINYKRNGFPDSVWVTALYVPLDLLATQTLERAWLRGNPK